jgi:hypothetical protein
MTNKTMYRAQNGAELTIQHPPLPCIGRIEVRRTSGDVFVRVIEDASARTHVFVMSGIGIWSGVRFVSPQRKGEQVVFFSCQLNEPRAVAVVVAGEGAVISTAGYNGRNPRRYKVGRGGELEKVDPFYEVDFTADSPLPEPTARPSEEIARQEETAKLFAALSDARERLVAFLNGRDHNALRDEEALGRACASLEAIARYVRRLTRVAETTARAAGVEKTLNDEELDRSVVSGLLGRKIKFEDEELDAPPAPAPTPEPAPAPTPEPRAPEPPATEPKPEPKPATEPKAAFEPFLATVVQGARGLVARADDGKEYFLPQKARQALRKGDVIRVTAITPAQRAGWLDGVKSYENADATAEA